jgi:hypothetical protein
MMTEQKEISFYDPKDLVLGDKRVTLRLLREGEDKYGYEMFFPGERFFIDMPEESNGQVMNMGIILGNWVLPLSSVPVECLLGEGYNIDIKYQENPQEIVQELRNTVKEDLGKYYEVTDDTFFHVIVYALEGSFDSSYLQGEGETLEEWTERVGDRVLGHIQAYNDFRRLGLI